MKKTGLFFLLVLGLFFLGCDSDQQEYLLGEGVYIGQIDPHSVEIELVSGEFRAFALSAELRGVWEIEALPDGQEIKFYYLEQEVGQPILIEIIE